MQTEAKEKKVAQAQKPATNPSLSSSHVFSYHHTDSETDDDSYEAYWCQYFKTFSSSLPPQQNKLCLLLLGCLRAGREAQVSYQWSGTI